jgi:hypothetical protein
MGRTEAADRLLEECCTALDSCRAAFYTAPMKAFLCLASALGACVVLCGCETEVPPDPAAPDNPGERLQRGITGQGTVYQPSREGDPFVQSENRVGQ